MAYHRYSTALSHLILFGVCIYCLKSYGLKEWKRFPLGTYGLMVVNSLLGVWYWGNPLHGRNVEKPYKLSGFLLAIFALPLIVTDTWLRNDQREFAFAHAAVSIIPLIQYLSAKMKNDLLDLIIVVNILSLTYVGFISENFFGMAAAVSFALNHFLLAKEREFLPNVPPEDLYNYGLCFFAYFALRTVTN